MNDLSANVTLELESWPQSVTLVRGMIAGVAEELRFEAELQDDLKTAVSEACNNVVMHAYDGVAGPLLVQLAVSAQAVEVTVRDEGPGIRQLSSSEDRMGVGLAVISALSERAEFLAVPDGGTEVRMSFPARWPHDSVPPILSKPRVPEAPRERPGGGIRGTLGPVSLIAPVLGRLTRVLAAGSHFSLDRFSDLYLVMDNLAVHAAEHGLGDRIEFGLEWGNRRLQVEIAPFAPGSGAPLTPTGVQMPLARLADEISVEEVDGAESLTLVLLDDRRPPDEG